MNSWVSNLGKCRVSLQSWSKSAFPTPHAQVSSLINDIEALYDSNAPDTHIQINGIIENIASLWNKLASSW